MTDAPKTAPAEAKEPAMPAEVNKPEVAGPVAPVDTKPAAEPAAPKK